MGPGSPDWASSHRSDRCAMPRRCPSRPNAGPATFATFPTPTSPSRDRPGRRIVRPPHLFRRGMRATFPHFTRFPIFPRPYRRIESTDVKRCRSCGLLSCDAVFQSVPAALFNEKSIRGTARHLARVENPCHNCAGQNGRHWDVFRTLEAQPFGTALQAALESLTGWDRISSW